MSHFSTIKTKIKNKPELLEALQLLQYDVQEDQELINPLNHQHEKVKVDVSNVNTHLIDSSVILGLVDSAYVDPLVESLGYRDSAQIVNIITANYINDRINQDYLNSAETISLVDSATIKSSSFTIGPLDVFIK